MTGGLAHLLLSPVSALYKREITRRNAKFDRGEGVVTLDRPVISIGNLSVGGTGKSPTVAMVVRTLRDAGFWPAVAMRGYGSGKTAHGSSDEADEYRALFPDLPIVAQPNRTLGLIELFGTEPNVDLTGFEAIALSVKASGRGGALRLALKELDGDEWEHWEELAMWERDWVHLVVPLDALERDPYWAQGDHVKDLSFVTTVMLQVSPGRGKLPVRDLEIELRPPLLLDAAAWKSLRGPG